MTKIYVFDTNSLISAHLLPTSITRKAFDIAWKNGILANSRDTLPNW